MKKNWVDYIFQTTIIWFIDLVVPIKLRRIKQNSQEWFEGEVAEKISIRNKLFNKFKKSKLHIDKEIYKWARYEVQKLISYTKKTFLKNRLDDSIGKPKELCKALKFLDLSDETSICQTNALKVNNTISFETGSTLDIFKIYYSTLADNLSKKLPTHPNKYTFNFVIQYHKHLFQTDSFYLTYTTEIDTEIFLRVTNVRKTAGIDEISVRFLKVGSQVISKPINELCNHSIILGNFPDSCKIAKLKILFKKGSKTIHLTDPCLTSLLDKFLKGFDKTLMTGMILIDL